MITSRFSHSSRLDYLNSLQSYSVQRVWTDHKGQRVVEVLAHDGRWYREASDTFQSLRDAKIYLKDQKNPFEGTIGRVTFAVIGPRGGDHIVSIKRGLE